MRSHAREILGLFVYSVVYKQVDFSIENMIAGVNKEGEIEIWEI